MESRNGKRKCNAAATTNLSSRISYAIGNQFYKLGVLVALHPWNTIIVSLLIVGMCSVGFIRFQIETSPLELWVPKGSEFLRTTKWIINHIDYGFRLQSVLLVSPNILEPKVLSKLAKIHWNIVETRGYMKNGTSFKWDDLCLKIPFIPEANEILTKQQGPRIRRQTGIFDDSEFGELFDEADNIKEKPIREFNPSVDLNPSIYCKFISNLPWGCYEKNILELWKYDVDKIENLTLAEVLFTLKNVTVSPVTGHETNFTELLGGIVRNEAGDVISASSVLSQWFLHLNFTEVKDNRIGNLAGTETWLTEETSAWEDAYLGNIENLKNSLDDNSTKIYYSAAKSFGDISYKTMFQETDKLALGVILMFIYVQLVLSKFSCTELRITLGSVGLLTIAFSFACACGICSALGVSYGPVHTSMPFLLMGLGVDDLFVMMACWRKIKHEKGSIPERMGLMLKHAGASITVTSLTDIVAFLVGSFTVIPSLQSFCLYAAVGVFMTYFFAITLFVAIFALDERRIEANRNTFFPCIVHKRDVKLCCELNLMHKFLKALYSKCILTKPGKIIVLMSVICLTGLSTVNVFKLQQKFDPMWFIPERTYLHKYISNMRIYFPEKGYQGSIFMGQLNYTESLPRIASLVNELEENNEHFYKVDAWVKPFFEFVKKYYYKDLHKETLTEYEWRLYLSKFLHSPNGGKYQANFRFNYPLKCGEPAGNVTVSWLSFQFKKFQSRDTYVPVMHELENMIERQNFTSNNDDKFAAAPWAEAYANWITDEIIDKEVLRNVSLAMICVMICTIVVIVDIQVCFWIFVCVLLTLVNVCGFMQMWGLTIDLVSCIGLQLAIGLCVDYAAHVGHNFLVMSSGDRNKRMLDAILHIGGAVLYGGGSTLLALLLLSKSEAYTFQSFFKIFFLVIVFGVFHGIILLPILLSTIGPKPYKSFKLPTNDDDKLRSNEEEMQPMNIKNDIKKSVSLENHDEQ